jgi:glycosyltransferase involved in cell wall biosynthesis
MEETLRHLVKKLSIPNVYFFGSVEQYDLPKYYSVADCLVLPSVEEVWGLVVNEALYSGLKVIVSDKCGSGPDLVNDGQNGYIFHAGSIDDLTNDMKKIALRISK